MTTNQTVPGMGTRASVRREALRGSLLESVDKLYRRRACDIPEGLIDDYVALDWLEWRGGALTVTRTGENVCSQLLRESA